ncbi:MAG: DUF493 domain-containing protein [Bacteroidota bacterium]
MSWDEEAFKEKLENTHAFPGEYRFKFIVKPELQNKVEQLVPHAKISTKPSSGNKYVSVTLHAEMQTSEEILKVYREAYKIEGIIAL